MNEKLDGSGCVLALVMGAAMLFVVPLLGVIFGAFSGWVVGLFFADPVLSFLTRIGVETSGLNVWEVGAAMGFLGGFLKTSVNRVSSK